MAMFDFVKKLNPWVEIGTLKKQVTSLERFRPFAGHNAYNPNISGKQIQVSKNALYQAARDFDILLVIHRSLRTEMFRNGIELMEAEETNSDIQDSEDTVQSSKHSRKQILDKVESVNDNSQSMLDVLSEIEDDVNTVDDGFVFFSFAYETGPAGNIISKELKEVLRVDPVTVNLVINRYDEYGRTDDGKYIVSCPHHKHESREVSQLDGQTCRKCDSQVYPVWYQQAGDNYEQNFFKWEMVHVSRYRPSKRLGYSPIKTLWAKLNTLEKQDEYILELYGGKRPPKGLLAANSSNQEGLKRAWEEMQEKARENPHLPALLAVQASPTGGNSRMLEYVDFMKPLNELQYTEQRDEYRRIIGAVYGVSPIFQADTSQSGGLNNEGLQITVTNRAVEHGQGMHNKILKKFIEVSGYDGWVLQLKPNEEQDEMAKLQMQNQSLMNGQLASQSGLEVEWNEDTGEAVIRSGSFSAQSQINMGFGGEDNQDNFMPPPNESIEPSGTPEMPPSGGLKKKEKLVTKAPKKEYTQLEKVIKAEISKFLKIYKRRPTKKELESRLEKIKRQLAMELREKSKNAFKKIYTQEADNVGRELNMNFPIEKVDQNVLEALSNQKVLYESYAKLSDKITKKINEVITAAYKDPAGLSTEKILKEMQEVVNIAEHRAENIIRTETTKVSAAARKNSYKKADPNDEFRYRHIGPSDGRTTELSKRIKNRTKNGVSWNQYVKIIEDESAKDFPEWKVDKDFPVSHYQSRHLFTRVQ